jgi:SulP family sulfate permease
VALALVPEAVAFAFVAGVSPMVGLHAAFIVGLVAAIAGGRPGMISGATGAMAVVLVGLGAAIPKHLGLDEGTGGAWLNDVTLAYICLAVLLAGGIQVLAGVLRLGKLIRNVQHSVMFGFVNGLAIIIFMAQLTQFKDPATETWLSTSNMVMMLALVVGTMATIYIVPKLTKAIPAPLAGIAAISVIVIAFGLDTQRVGDIAKVGGSFPSFAIPGFGTDVQASAEAAGVTLPGFWTLDTLKLVFPFACILAAVGLIESLMTMSLIDEMTETRGRGNRECVGQGLANVTCGVFGAMGGCAMIGQSMINIQSGGRGRTSGIAAALFLLAFVLFGSGLIELIPVAALVGVMFMVVIGTFEWSSLRILHRVPLVDALVIISVTVITVATENLALAVLVGVLLATLAFAWKQASAITAEHVDREDGVRDYHLRGVLFFASVTSFRDHFDVAKDPDEVIIDFAEAKVLDHSAIEAINALTERYQKAGKKLHLRHLSDDCKRLLGRAATFIDINVMEDPHYKVADDLLD